MFTPYDFIYVAKTLNLKINVMIQEGESYLKKSFQEEKNDLPSALSMVTHATSKCWNFIKMPSCNELVLDRRTSL